MRRLLLLTRKTKVVSNYVRIRTTLVGVVHRRDGLQHNYEDLKFGIIVILMSLLSIFSDHDIQFYQPLSS